MFSGSSFHTGTRVYCDFKTSSITFCGASSMSMVCILVRCTMMSSTCRSLRSRTPPSMSASPFATAPPIVFSSMVPRISSWAARMFAASSRRVGVIFRISRTMNWITVVSGPSRTIITRMIGATNSATRSANASA